MKLEMNPCGWCPVDPPVNERLQTDMVRGDQGRVKKIFCAVPVIGDPLYAKICGTVHLSKTLEYDP